MAQIAPISLLDGKGTAETHVFNPKAVMPPVYKRDVSTQPAAAWESVAVKVKLAQGSSPNIIDLELQVPVMEQVTGGSSTGYVAPPRVAHVMKFKGSFFLDNRSDTSGRKDLRVLVSNLLKDPQVISAIEGFEQPY